VYIQNVSILPQHDTASPRRRPGFEIYFSLIIGLRTGRSGSYGRFPAGVGNFSLHHRVQNGSGAHPASYPMGSGGSFPGGEAAGA
jgi:hypothetical protein